jgi:hypothetical protein
MKSLAHAQRHRGAAKQPLETPHQVAMPNQSQVVLLAKTNTYS